MTLLRGQFYTQGQTDTIVPTFQQVFVSSIPISYEWASCESATIKVCAEVRKYTLVSPSK